MNQGGVQSGSPGGRCRLRCGRRFRSLARRLRLFRLAENIIRTCKASPAFGIIRLLGKAGGKAFYHTANHRLPIFRGHRLGGSDVLLRRPYGGPGLRSKFARRNFPKTRLHDFAPRRIGWGISEQRL
jgi:hypothetical protein